MKIKQPIIKIIQVGTLFLITSFSFLWMISFSNPEISSFWNVKKLNLSFSHQAFAESGKNEKRKKRYKKESWENNDYKNNNNESKIKESEYQASIISTNPNVTNNNTSWSNVTSTNPNCKIITEKVYDTVTSASGTQSKKPKKVKREVCTPLPITPIVETVTQAVTPVIIKTKPIANDVILNNKPIEIPIVQKIIQPMKITLYKAPNGKNYNIIQKNQKFTIQKADGIFVKQSFSSYFQAIAYLNQNATLPVKVNTIKIKPVKKPVVTKPVVTKPVVTKPVVTKPVVTKPVVNTVTKAS